MLRISYQKEYINRAFPVHQAELIMSLDTPFHPSLTHCQIMIKELMELRGHSVARIARSCDLTPSVIHDILKGHTKQPRPTVFRKILMLHCWSFHRPGINMNQEKNEKIGCE